MEFGFVLGILACIAVGVSSAVVSSWGLRRQVHNLQVDIEELRDKQLSIVRTKAADGRWQKRDADKELAKELVNERPAVAANRNPWDLPF